MYWKSSKKHLVICVLFLLTLIGSAFSQTPEFRSLYVYSWGSNTFLNWKEVSTLVNVARTYNYNAIVPEVRKAGDAYYTSMYEPKANNPAVNDPSPTFDALSAMIKYAHDTSNGKKYIEVHAWMVANRIWKGALSGAPSGHILKVHPEWAMYDDTGTTANSEGMYLDVGIPGAQQHQVNVWMDVVKRYDIDGIALDYIRYPGNTWGYNTISLARFNRLTGLTATTASAPAEFDQFRRDNVTSIVKKLYVNAYEAKPNVKVSICAIPWGYTTTDFYASSAYNDIFQDWKQFMEGHFLDYLSPMVYDPDSTAQRALRYRNWNLACKNWSGGRHVYMLQGSYMNNTIQNLNQLYYSRETAHCEGIQIYRYGYATLAGTTTDEMRLYAFLTTKMLQTPVATPEITWKTHPVYGIIKGTVTYSNQTIDSAVVSLLSGSTVFSVTTCDATGFYAFIDVDTSYNYDIRGDGTRWSLPQRTVYYHSVTAGQVLNVDIQLQAPVVAGFYGTPTIGRGPLSVNFVDTSANSPTTWAWDFGDGQTSSLQNPQHIYAQATVNTLYTVQLIVTNAYSTSTAIYPDYIKVTGPLQTQLVDLKLFRNESLDSAINMPDQFAGDTVNYYLLLDNFLNLCSVNGDYVSQDAYALVTTGTNSFYINGSFGITTSESAVKYSSYKLKKLPYMGIIPGTYQDFPIYQYAFDSLGGVIPESFGYTDALSVSDTTKINAAWLNSSTIRITAVESLDTAVFVDIVAAPVTSKPFGADIDRERMWVFPSLLTTAGFTYAENTSIFSYQKALFRAELASVSQDSTVADAGGETASGVLKFDFANESSGIKATLIPSQWKEYETAQWYTVRMRVFSPDTENQHQAMLYQYDNPVAPGNHIDLGAYVCFGVPTVWTWVEQSLYCQQSGTGYPQLVLNAGGTGSLYVDEIQWLHQTPAVLDNLRNPGNLKYPYGQF